MISESFLKGLSVEALRQLPYDDSRFPPSEYYRFLRLLTERLRPRLSVELGVCRGGGSLHLSLGWPSGIVVGIDEIVEYTDNLEFIRSVCPNFHILIGDSIDSVKVVYDKFGLVDVLFIDALHEHDRVLAEMAAWRPYLSKEAVVCFDDLRNAKMGAVWEELPGDKLRLDELHATDEAGFGVIWNLP